MRSRSIRRSACSTLPKSGWSRVKRPAPVREYAAGAASACGGLYPGLSSRLLTMADLPAVAALRAAVLAELAVPDLYVPEEPAFMPAHISGCGVTNRKSTRLNSSH